MVQEEAKKASEPVEPFEKPPFEPLKDIRNGLSYVLFNPQGNRVVMPLLLLLESLLLKLIIKNVNYTEIDYQAYMEQIDMINEGETDYSVITGGTGPLVYPAGHVWIFMFMNWVTNGMENVPTGQQLFRYVYMLQTLLEFVIYSELEVPPWCTLLACLSKRLHSIYVLRLFNDSFTTLFITATVLLFVKITRTNNAHARKFMLIMAALVYSIAVSIKMNALLYLPAVMVSFYMINEGEIFQTLVHGAIIVVWQIIVAAPFLKEHPLNYFHGAFNFGRQFMYKWSVNWQIIEEEGFSNKWFHLALLISHLVAILIILVSHSPHFFKIALKTIKTPFHPHPEFLFLDKTHFVPFFLITSNFVGVIFSRSLHYQFLAWYHWTLPILMHWSRLPIYLGVPWYFLHEYCWNSYPPNATASLLLSTLNGIMLNLVIFYGNAPKLPHIKPITEKKNN